MLSQPLETKCISVQQINLFFDEQQIATVVESVGPEALSLIKGTICLMKSVDLSLLLTESIQTPKVSEFKVYLENTNMLLMKSF
jgi:hypothetical protein